MGARLVVGLVVSALVAGCRPATRNTLAAVQTAGFASPGIASLVPTAAFVQGWTVAEGPLTFRPDTLYEYLDGGAPRYVDYGFREAVHVRYACGGDAQAAVTLDIYDMGGALGAFGIYSSARPPGVQARPWGAEGYRFETVAAAWKGPVYVHVQADDERRALVGMAERLAADVAGRAPGQIEAPAILRPLPPGGRVAGSVRYVARDLLGHAFLPGGVMATYAVEGGEARLYFSELKDAAAAAAEGRIPRSRKFPHRACRGKDRRGGRRNEGREDHQGRLAGKVLSVFGTGGKRIETATAIAGTRGTGMCIEADAEVTYLCLCYGGIDLDARTFPGERKTYDTKRHEQPYYVLSAGSKCAFLKAPMMHHTDEELAMLEALVGRKPPFGSGGGGGGPLGY